MKISGGDFQVQDKEQHLSLLELGECTWLNANRWDIGKQKCKILDKYLRMKIHNY